MTSMLLQLTPTNLRQRCDHCGETPTISFGDIVAGIEAGEPPEPIDPNIIRMPECAGCGSVEFLNRVAASEPTTGPHAEEHRRAVNALHAALVAAGRAAATIAAYFAAESLETEKVDIPWSASFEPKPITAVQDSAAESFAAFVAAHRGET
jgi:hypothetical protein